jgi:hypothetical protein
LTKNAEDPGASWFGLPPIRGRLKEGVSAYSDYSAGASAAWQAAHQQRLRLANTNESCPTTTAAEYKLGWQVFFMAAHGREILGDIMRLHSGETTTHTAKLARHRHCI